MTRQWLMPPEYMCKQHLLGEHLEAHIFVSKMQKSHSLEGFRRGSMFFGASYITFRHDVIAPLFSGHKTPLTINKQLIEKYPLVIPT